MHDSRALAAVPVVSTMHEPASEHESTLESTVRHVVSAQHASSCAPHALSMHVPQVVLGSATAHVDEKLSPLGE
jgi:hypothetical protein